MRFIPLCAAALYATSVGAQELEADKARFATNVFASICIFGQGRTDAPGDYVEYRLRPLVAEAQRFFLDGRPGKAWGSEVARGNVVVAISEDGECLVRIRRLAPSQAETFFKGAISLLGERATIEAHPEERETRPSGDISVLRYSFRAVLNSIPYEVKLATTDSTQSPIQVTLSSKVKR